MCAAGFAPRSTSWRNDTILSMARLMQKRGPDAMQTTTPLRSTAQQPQPASPRQVLAPRGERNVDESRPVVALEPHWAAAIDAATD
jgi:hypothetical protein